MYVCPSVRLSTWSNSAPTGRILMKFDTWVFFENFETILKKFHYHLTRIKDTLNEDHHHHISVMELGHLLTRSGLTYPEVSSKVCHDSFCQLGNSVSLPWVIYCEAFYLHVLSSSSRIPVTWRPNVNLRGNFAEFFLEWEIFYTEVVEKINTHILRSIAYFRKSCHLWHKVEKYCRVGQTTDDNMAHWMLDT
jgi:hypothetical protein